MALKKIRFLHDIFVRSTPEDLAVPPIGVLYAGAELWVQEDPVPGVEIEGVHWWYRDTRGWYFWSGAIEDVEDAALPKELEELAVDDPLLGRPIAWKELYFDARTMNWGINYLEILDGCWKKHRLTGKGVKVAILDTGIDYYHPDLKDAIRGFKNFSSSDWGKHIDKHGNGTMCAGLIAARGAYKVYGLAPEVDLYVGKIMQHPFQPSFDALMAGLSWAGEQQVDLVYTSANIPAEQLTEDQLGSLRRMAEKLDDQNIFMLSPAGNSLQKEPSDRMPAALSAFLSVGAHGMDERRLETSIRSSSLDVLAPGERLLTTSPDFSTDYFGGSLAAAALGAGVICLLIEYVKRRQRSISTKDLRKLIRRYSEYSGAGSKCEDVETGCGLIRPMNVLNRLQG